MNAKNLLRNVNVDFSDKRTHVIMKYAVLLFVFPSALLMLIYVVNSVSSELNTEIAARSESLTELAGLLDETRKTDAKIAEIVDGLNQSSGALTKESILKDINDVSARNGVYIKQIAERQKASSANEDTSGTLLSQWEFTLTLSGSTSNILRVIESLSDAYAVKIAEIGASPGQMSFVIAFTDISEAVVP